MDSADEVWASAPVDNSEKSKRATITVLIQTSTLTFDRRHDQEVDPVLAADVVQRANVRVVQAGDGLRLALEPLLEIGVRGDMLGEHLDGDGAVESRVPRLVDFSHTASPDGGDDLIRPELPSGFKRHA